MTDRVHSTSKKTHRKARENKKRIVKQVQIDAAMKPYIGSMFVALHCYRAPDVVRIVGASKSGKSFKVEDVPVECTHWNGGGNGWIKCTWLKDYPITDGIEGRIVRHSFETDNDKTKATNAVVRPALEAHFAERGLVSLMMEYVGKQQYLLLKMEGEYFLQLGEHGPLSDEQHLMKYSWCEY
jgi:hypothetical protein